jgi:hypothetical protein
MVNAAGGIPVPVPQPTDTPAPPAQR